MNICDKLSSKSVVVVSYVSTPIPIANLEDFLKTRAAEVIILSQSFFFNLKNGSTTRRYRGGVLKQTASDEIESRSEIIYYFKTAWRALCALLHLPKTDVFIGLGNLPALVGIILRAFGKTKIVIYYAIDFVPRRFPQWWLNTIYHFLDNFVIRHVDCIWNLSPIMIEMREKKGIPVTMRTKQITVPIGTNPLAPRLPFDQIDKHTAVYVGHLRPLQGLELLLDCWPKVLAFVRDARLIIIGHGSLEGELRVRAAKLGIAHAIEFKGFIKNQSEVEQVLSRCGLAVAPYVDNEEAFVRYTDPGKIKTYISSGLPVVITDVPAIAQELKREKCGVVAPYSPEAYAENIIKFFRDEALLREYRNQAFCFAQQYHWDHVFNRAFDFLHL